MRIVVLLLVMAGVGLALNILPNPSFEVWLDSLGVPMPFGWLTSEYLRQGSALKDTQANTGDYCLLLAGGDTAAFATSATVVRPGQHYEFAGHTLVSSVLGGSFMLQFLSQTGNPVGQPVLLPVYFSTSYRRYSQWVTAPDSALFLSVSLATLPGVEVRLDDVTVEDTTLGGIADEPQPGCRPAVGRKVVVAGDRPGSSASGGGLFYDALGRLAGTRGPGVYFRR